MLVAMKEILDRAREGHYGVAMPCVDNEHNLRACLDAAEELRAPLILGVGFSANPDIRYFGRMMTDLAVRATVPVATILDHGLTFEKGVIAISAGFTSIMADRSSLPYEENVAQVKELVSIAHAAGVSVEAELGHVGVGLQYDTDGSNALTDPDEAVRFVEATGVDALAVAIGSAHGVYTGEPKLRFELLSKLREAVPVPLVLHGGSGTGEKNLKKACELGICKINLANDLKRAAIEALMAEGTGGNSVYNMYPAMARGCKEKLMQYIRIFGSDAKAWTRAGGMGFPTAPEEKGELTL